MDEAQAVTLLVRRCVSGDATAWEEIVQRFSRRVYNVCYRFSGSSTDAEDLTQEVFLKVYRTLSSYDPGRAAFNTWLTTVARNLLVDHFRRTKNDRATDSLDASPRSEEDEGQPLVARLADGGPGPESHLRDRERREVIHKALQRLSPELREAVVLRDLQDLDYREIAQVLRVPEGTVKSRINRGRAELARTLQRNYRQVM